jgi:putative endonuclease
MNSRNGWFLYILECADGSFYTGITNDLEKRLLAHNEGTASKYTRARTPVRIVYSEPVGDRSSATKRELQIKKLSRTQKSKLIQNWTS